MQPTMRLVAQLTGVSVAAKDVFSCVGVSFLPAVLVFHSLNFRIVQFLLVEFGVFYAHSCQWYSIFYALDVIFEGIKQVSSCWCEPASFATTIVESAQFWLDQSTHLPFLGSRDLVMPRVKACSLFFGTPLSLIAPVSSSKAAVHAALVHQSTYSRTSCLQVPDFYYLAVFVSHA